ncbi:MAG: hypothetical protein NTW04_01990 [Elusimicrobia bacterium]|nr:hypothetical protein [Elusimicrobiota bacterium]
MKTLIATLFAVGLMASTALAQNPAPATQTPATPSVKELKVKQLAEKTELRKLHKEAMQTKMAQCKESTAAMRADQQKAMQELNAKHKLELEKFCADNPTACKKMKKAVKKEVKTEETKPAEGK